MQLVILTAGRGRRLWPLTLTQPKALLSAGGRPVVFHMLLPLVRQGFRDVTFVVSPSHTHLFEVVVGNALAHSGVSLRWIEQPEPGGPGHAFSLAADVITGPTLLLLADTLAQPPTDYSCDWIGIAPIEPDDHSRWCTVAVDERGFVTELIDKPVSGPSPDQAAVGLYFFTDSDGLREAMAKAVAAHGGQMAGSADTVPEFQLKPIIDYYRQDHPVRALEIANWRDIGTLRDYNQTVRSLLPGRVFTDLTVSADGRVFKRTRNGSAPRWDEAAWFQAIPTGSLLAPRFLGEDADRNGYALEYVDYLSLAEYYTFGQLPAESLTDILTQLLKALRVSLWERRDSGEASERARTVYLHKTLSRLRSWGRPDLVELDALEVNGERVPGLWPLWAAVRPMIDELVDTSPDFDCMIHGDLSFANILYSPRSGMLRLVDPRGNFGGPGPYGDMRYDGAKLRQCYHGHYDLIVADLFEVTEHGPGVFDFWTYPEGLPSWLALDELLTAFHFIPRQIATIEALLFLSMLPLHSDSPRRQLAFFLTGVRCLQALAGA